MTHINAVYDNAGNLTSAVQGHLFSYDAENRMTSHDDLQTVAIVDNQYFYDGEGKRVKKIAGNVSTIYAYNAFGQMVAEYSDTSSAGSLTSYYTIDNLGTPRVITNKEGGVISRHDYLPFGEEISSGVDGRTAGQGYVNDGVRQKFTGKERDSETGLDYFEARYYASSQGRFTSVDPVGLTVDRLYTPQKINLYAYCQNNPLAFIDPTGETIDYANKDSREAFDEYEKFLNKDPKKYASELATLKQLKDSDVNYVIKLNSNSSDFSNGKEGNLTSDGKNVYINIANVGNSAEKFSLNSRLGHELEHARQFDSGEFAFAFDNKGKMIGLVAFDISEEVKAWNAGLNLASARDFQATGGSRISELQFRVFDELGKAKTEDERAQVLARLSQNYKSSYARGGYGTNFTLQGVPPGTLVRPGDKLLNNGKVTVFGRTYKP